VTRLHSIHWFLTTGIHDPAWVQAAAAVFLVALTFVTFVVLVIYARDTHTLAKTSKVSAEAAERSSRLASEEIQAMIGKERARIFVVPSEHCSFRGTVDNFIGIIPQGFVFLNAGPTPAINVRVSYNAVLTQFETEATGKAEYQAPIQEVIAANDKATASFRVRTAFGSGKAPQIFYAHVWGEVTYNDVISSEPRGTKFRFRMTIRQSRVDDTISSDRDWIKFGPPEDNRAT
jgi:hypothetical protein